MAETAKGQYKRLNHHADCFTEATRFFLDSLIHGFASLIMAMQDCYAPLTAWSDWGNAANIMRCFCCV